MFISFGSEDEELARRVCARLNGEGNHRAFFSDATLNHGPFARQIDHALDTAWAFVAVGSRVEYLHKSWVRYEWESYHNDILSGRKPQQTPFVAFVTDIDLNDLPRPFRERRAVQAKLPLLEEAFGELQ